MKMIRKRAVIRLLVSVLIGLVIIIMLIPIVFVIFNAFKTKNEYINNVFLWPHEWSFSNFDRILREYNFPRMFLNSLLLTAVSVFVCSYLGALAAFAVGKFHFHGKWLLQSLLIPLMSIPGVVLLIPLFVLFTKLGLTNTFIAPICIYIGLILPFTINMMASFMSSLPNSLIEAAAIDGCGWMKIFHRIVLPLTAPGISAATIVNVMWVWNELMIAFVFLQDEGKRTLIIGLTSLQGLFNLDVPLLMAGAFAASLPVIILYIFSQKWFIKGLTAGGVK